MQKTVLIKATRYTHTQEHCESVLLINYFYMALLYPTTVIGTFYGTYINPVDFSMSPL